MGVGLETDGTCTMVIMPVKVLMKGGLRAIETYAFLDPGSSASFCTESLMRQLGTSGKPMKLNIDSMGKPRTINTYAVSGMQVCNLAMENHVALPKMFTVEKLPVSKIHIPTSDDIKDWTHLRDVEIPIIDAEIGIMIGNNIADAYTPIEVRTGPDHAPHATRTRLGWALWNVTRPASATRCLESIRCTVNRTDVAVHECEEFKQLDRMVRHSFNIDFPERIIDDEKQHSQEDKVFLKGVDESIKLCDGHYEISLPFREQKVSFPNNYSLAFKRLMGLKRQMEQDDKFRLEYTDFMNKMLEKGYAEHIPDDEPEPDDGLVWYIPHHGVYHPKKMKLRVVFNCAATYNGTSLNQQLLSGPDLTNNLIGVLVRFRQENVAAKGDIESMFYQVWVTKAHWNYQRFLWWQDGDYGNPPLKYRMKVHMFGTTSSPSCANAALLKTANDNEEKYEPEIAEIVRNNFYVDDCLFSEQDVTKTVSCVTQVSSLCQQGGFRLTKWVSNSAEVLDKILPEDRAEGVKDLNLDQLETGSEERALGVVWTVHTDSLGFKVNVKYADCTRRHVLSVVSSIYDPLGMVSPFVLKAKILLQDMCRQGLGWDEEVSGTKLTVWQQWIADLPLLEKVSIPRCYKPSDFGTIRACQLHIFSDASNEGYGLTAYLRMKNEMGKVHCSLVMAKARVTPIKKVTTPRLELTAACVAVRLSRILQKELQYKLTDIYYWTDSMSVIRYVNNEISRFKTFVANRITIIRDGSDPRQWKHIPTALNPADAASRGMRMATFLKMDQWFKGPTFLWESEEEWPSVIKACDNFPEDDPEMKPVVAATVTDEPVDIMNRLLNYSSSWLKLKKIVGWFLLFMDYLKMKMKEKQESAKPTKECAEHLAKSKNTKVTVQEEKSRGHLTVKIMEKAEVTILCYIQQQYFHDVISALKNPSKESRLNKSIRKLDPFLEDGLLRVGGRLSQASLPYEVKHPIILPKKCFVSQLIVQDSHESMGHMGKAAMMTYLRQRYWIQGVGHLIKKITSTCVICRRCSAQRKEQKMADLPVDRLTAGEPPFSRVGVDFFGPFVVKRGRSNVKRYGVVFTCLALRAVHLELAASLDTSSCVNAFRRFFARRGHPKKVWTDNGTNLVGCEREMREDIHLWNIEQLHQTFLQRNISWEFNPPSASHHGGVWERMIRTVRRILYSLLHSQVIHLDDDGLQTLFCEVEVIVNSRPITTVTNDVKDLKPLTPNDLLMLRSGGALPPGLFRADDCYAKRQWRRIQYLSDSFWKRWSKEYLTMLQERVKWTRVRKNISVNDIVLVMDNLPRNSWSLGRVVEVYADKKGFVRIVRIKTPTSTVLRPISKLCVLLEVNSDSVNS